MLDSGNLVFWSDVNEFLNQLKSGDVDIGHVLGRPDLGIHDQGNPDIKYLNPAPGAVISPVIIQKVKNSSSLGWAFIKSGSVGQAQQCWGNALQYGVANRNVKYEPTVEPRITKLREILWPPVRPNCGHDEDWLERWNKEITR